MNFKETLSADSPNKYTVQVSELLIHMTRLQLMFQLILQLRYIIEGLLSDDVLQIQMLPLC